MLETLDIKNWILVQQLTLDFKPNMTLLTGETGAGKSILIDALNAVLGAKVDKLKIRQGQERAEITASFNIENNQKIQDFLIAQQLESDNDCILRRVIVQQGRSRSYINHHIVTRELLRQIGVYLIYIHGQNAHQSLLKKAYQRDLLDLWGNHQFLLNKVALYFKQWQQAKMERNHLQQQNKECLDRLDLLQFQAQELAQLNPQKAEFEQLNQEQKQLANAELVLTLCQQSIDSLSEGQNPAQRQISKTIQYLDELKKIYPSLHEAEDLLNEALIQIEEVQSQLIDLKYQVELDPNRLQMVDQRLVDYLGLSKKFRCEPEELILKQDNIQSEITLLSNTDEQILTLQKEISAYWEQYQIYAKKLTIKRKKSAKALAKLITQGMQGLSMKGGIFEIHCKNLEKDKVTASGMDEIEFRVSTNTGQSPQSLAKTASGGELSRISLAIQVASSNCNLVPTLVFDEVDVGIGGGVAEIVGQQLAQLAQCKQILCVTHLPQVASQGQHHWQVKKTKDRTEIKEITGEERITEIARMLGGVKQTKQSLAHAKEMLVKSTSIEEE